MESIVKEAKEYAIKHHSETNHMYDGMPYKYHLEDVFYVGLKFIYIIPKHYQEKVLSALWCHDLIEDCRITYNDLKHHTDEQVADLVYAVTNEKGKNRSERANKKYYDGILNCQYATFVKLCDRIANVEYSSFKHKINDKNTMLSKYRLEHQFFSEALNLSRNSVPLNTIYLDMYYYLTKITFNK